jgi:hypothetical protein
MTRASCCAILEGLWPPLGGVHDGEYFDSLAGDVIGDDIRNINQNEFPRRLDAPAAPHGRLLGEMFRPLRCA